MSDGTSDNYYSKYVICGYLRAVENRYSLSYPMPNGIYDIFAAFYYQHFIAHDLMKRYVTNGIRGNAVEMMPFLIVHALMKHRPFLHTQLSMSIEQQCDDLLSGLPSDLNDKLPKIIVECILLYRQRAKLLSKETSNILHWSSDDIMISCIYHLVNIPSSDDRSYRTRNHQKLWEFVSFLRLYFEEKQIGGTQLWQLLIDCKKEQSDNRPTKGFGLLMMKNICTQYSLKSGPFSKVKKLINIWAEKLRNQFNGIEIDIYQQQLSCVESELYSFCDLCDHICA